MPLEFSAQSKQRIERMLSRYPNKQAALLPVLHIAQDEFGHLPDRSIELVAKTVDVPPAHVFGVVTFYTMFHREKHGQERADGVHQRLVHAARRRTTSSHHIEQQAGHQARRDHPRRRVHAGRGGVPGRVRERADDDLRPGLLPRPDARRRSTPSWTTCAAAGASSRRRSAGGPHAARRRAAATEAKRERGRAHGNATPRRQDRHQELRRARQPQAVGLPAARRLRRRCARRCSDAARGASSTRSRSRTCAAAAAPASRPG